MSDSNTSEVEESVESSKLSLSIWELAWPAILSNLLFSIIGIASIKIVGELGASAVASVTTGHRIFFALQAILMAISAGTTALVARSIGAKDPDEAAKITSASLWIGNIVAIVLMLPCIFFSREIASVFGLDEETTIQAGEFIRWLSYFNIAFAINMVLGAALRAAGDTRTPLWIGVITNVINLILVYVLVYGKFGVPQMGVPGAAIANGLSFLVGAIVLLILWQRRMLVIGIGGFASLTRPRIKKLVDIGYPAGLEQLVFQAGFLAFLWLVAKYGTAAFAAYGIGVQILSMSFVVGFGFSIAGATLVGQHLGARDPVGARRQGWRATRLAVLSMVVLGAGIVIAAPEIARFLIDDDEVVKLTVIFIFMLGISQPLMAIEFTLGGCLRGAGDTRFPLIATLTGLIGVRVGLAFIFLMMDLPVEYIYGALIADYVVKAIMLIKRYESGKWQNILADKEAADEASVNQTSR